LAVGGQLLLKRGMADIGTFSLSISTMIQQYVRILLNPFVVTGIFSFALSMLVWLYVLSRVELSIAYPFVALNYVLILLGSHFLFGESVTPVKVIGVAVIVLGIYLIARAG
jgi:drug/metabolite transporter (DMT)-like permease